MDKVSLEAAKEIEKIAINNNISVHDLIEEYKKAYSLTDQDKENKRDKNETNIL